MNCEHAKDQLIDYLSDQLPDKPWAELNIHLARCPECRQELQAIEQLWQAMGKLPTPEPSPNLRTEFYSMLETYQASLPTARALFWAAFVARLRWLLLPPQLGRLAYSLGLIGLGMAAGYWLNRQKTPIATYQQQVRVLSTQVEEMRQGMLLSLLENPSATERLRAVSSTKDIGQVNAQILEALLSTLNHDPNVNVRLVTLEVLAQRADDPKVREGLVQSLARQESPLVQSALADVMVLLQEKRSVKPLRQLLRQENLNVLVKDKIEQSIKALS